MDVLTRRQRAAGKIGGSMEMKASGPPSENQHGASADASQSECVAP